MINKFNNIKYKFKMAFKIQMEWNILNMIIIFKLLQIVYKIFIMDIMS